MANVGVITEQGDLGLGFDQLNEKDAKAVVEATNDEEFPAEVLEEHTNNK